MREFVMYESEARAFRVAMRVSEDACQHVENCEHVIRGRGYNVFLNQTGGEHHVFLAVFDEDQSQCAVVPITKVALKALAKEASVMFRAQRHLNGGVPTTLDGKRVQKARRIG